MIYERHLGDLPIVSQQIVVDLSALASPPPAKVFRAAAAPSRSVPPHLIASSPAAGASVAAVPTTIELDCNRELLAESTTAIVHRRFDRMPASTGSWVDPTNPMRLRVIVGDDLPSGEYVVEWHAVAAAGAASQGDFDFSLRPEAGVAPQLGISPDTAETGDVLEVVGRGFHAESIVELTIGDDHQPLKSIQTDSRGGLNEEVRIPPRVPYGVQAITAQDESGSQAAATVQLHWGGSDG